MNRKVFLNNIAIIGSEFFFAAKTKLRKYQTVYMTLFFICIMVSVGISQSHPSRPFKTIKTAQKSLLKQEFLAQVRTDDWKKIETILLCFIELEPNNIPLLCLYGECCATVFEAQKDRYSQLSFDYFHKAKAQFLKVLELEEDHFQAHYALGKLQIQKVTVIARNTWVPCSKEGAVAYDNLMNLLKKEYDLALPFLQKAEQLNPNDVPTLMLLCDFLARQNAFEVVKELKSRMEHIEKGERFQQSFFLDNH